MSWKPQLFKPKWEHKDAEVRLAAVSSAQDPDLLDKLLDIAAADPDVRVRCAAIQRVHRLENILKLHAAETDNAARQLLLERIRQLAGNSEASRPPLDVRMRAVVETADKQLVEHLAVNAPEAELRRKAIGMVRRQGLLGDCCIGDEDAANRRLAAERIEQHTTLRRVITGLRTRDKDLYQQLQRRLHEELLAKADPEAIGAEALNICLALEKLALGETTPGAPDRQALHAAWQRIEAKVPNELQVRYRRVCERLAAPPIVQETTPTQPPASEETADGAAQPAVRKAAPEPDRKLAEALAAVTDYRQKHGQRPAAKKLAALGQRVEKSWAAVRHAGAEDRKAKDTALTTLAELSATLEALQQRSARNLEQAQALLAQLQQELDDGELHKALASRARLLEHIRENSNIDGQRDEWRKIRDSLQASQGRLRELRDWQHWSNNKIRKRLIREMEVLPRADLHPDALLNRVKSLQAEWRALEDSEQIPGDKHFAAAPWMWRKFNAAGHAAFETAKPFLDKRSEIQSRHAQSLATFCAELKQLATADPPDWPALGKAINRGRRKMRTLGDVPAAERQKCAQDLKAALDQASAVMQTHYDAIEKDKLKLIRKASALVHTSDRDEAIALAKQLQAQWKAAGSLWRSKEQTLWKQFRSHLDPLFDELKEQQDRLRAVSEEKLARQRDLRDQLAAILTESSELATQQGKVQGLVEQWGEIDRPEREIQGDFQRLLEDYRGKLESERRQQQQQERERLWRKSQLLHDIAQAPRERRSDAEFGAQIKAAWPAENSDASEERSLDGCFETWLQDPDAPLAEDDAEAMSERARLLCIRLEFLAGLPSPEADAKLRMQYQVDRLAQSMAGSGERLSAAQE
ncbi:MAG: DUF349 domain-containing protein, partial [Lysobacterales bacterium]